MPVAILHVASFSSCIPSGHPCLLCPQEPLTKPVATHLPQSNASRHIDFFLAIHLSGNHGSLHLLQKGTQVPMACLSPPLCSPSQPNPRSLTQQAKCSTPELHASPEAIIFRTYIKSFNNSAQNLLLASTPLRLDLPRPRVLTSTLPLEQPCQLLPPPLLPGPSLVQLAASGLSVKSLLNSTLHLNPRGKEVSVLVQFHANLLHRTASSM